MIKQVSRSFFFLLLTGLGFILAIATLLTYLLLTATNLLWALILASSSLILIGVGGFYFMKALEAQKTKLTVLEPKHLIGRKGVAKSVLKPGVIGIVWVSGDYWTAEAEEEIQDGQEIEVKSVDGLRLHVASIKRTAS